MTVAKKGRKTTQPKTLEYFRSEFKAYRARSSSPLYIYTANHILSLRTWWKRKFAEQKSPCATINSSEQESDPAPAWEAAGKNTVLSGAWGRLQVATSMANLPSTSLECGRRQEMLHTYHNRNALLMLRIHPQQGIMQNQQYKPQAKGLICKWYKLIGVREDSWLMLWGYLGLILFFNWKIYD